MIQLEEVLQKTLVQYNRHRENDHQGPVANTSRQIKALAETLVDVINHELKKKADMPNRLGPSYTE